RTRVLGKGEAFVEVAAALQAARQRIPDWAIERKGWSAVDGGLKRVYQSGSKAFAAAVKKPMVENLHEWRKQGKYLWHQLQVLQPVWPKVMGQLADQAHQLGDYLGDDHDLAVLGELVTEQPEKFGKSDTVEALVALVDRRRDELQEEAYPLGQRLYCD